MLCRTQGHIVVFDAAPRHLVPAHGDSAAHAPQVGGRPAADWGLARASHKVRVLEGTCRINPIVVRSPLSFFTSAEAVARCAVIAATDPSFAPGIVDLEGLQKYK